MSVMGGSNSGATRWLPVAEVELERLGTRKAAIPVRGGRRYLQPGLAGRGRQARTLGQDTSNTPDANSALTTPITLRPVQALNSLMLPP
jgi:hypothetical protein